MGETFWLRDIRTRKILYVNPAFETLWGRSRESLMADPELFMNCVHPEDRGRIEKASEVLLSSDLPFSFSEEYRIVRPDGSVRWVQTRINPVFDDSRKLIRYAGIAEDIILQTPDLKVIWANRAAATKMGKEPSEMIGLTCHLLRFGKTEPCLNCPVEVSLRTLSPAQTIKASPSGRIIETLAITEQAKLEEQLRQAQKMQSVGTLAGGVAHDFNNILTSIIGNGHMALIKAGADAPVRTHIKQMLDDAGRASKLTDGLLAYRDHRRAHAGDRRAGTARPHQENRARDLRRHHDRVRGRGHREHRFDPRLLERESRTVRIGNDLDAIYPVIRELTANAAAFGFDVEATRIALLEALTNAIEHGSLGISLEEKRAALREGTLIKRPHTPAPT